MATKTDAKSQQTQYTYDSYGDLIQVSRGTVSGGVFTEDVPQRVNYTYGAQGAQNNSAGRLKSITYNNSPGISENYQYTAPGQVTKKSLSVNGAGLNASYTYDNEGRMLTVTYPYNPALQSLPEYTYGFDPMGRLNTMTTTGGSLVSAVTYNAANQVLSIAGLSESRTYNANGQLTNLTSGSYHYAYNYSATQNNGRIASMQDVASGETITYAYDSLKRLIGASGTGDPQGSWSQTFSHDGFGNLLSKIGNNAPNVTSYTVNAATNQMTSNGATYDANGNMTANGSPGQVTTFSYDEANRISQITPPGNPTNNSQAGYAYDAANQRVFASISTTVNSVYKANYYIYFYGADGKKLGVWQLTNPYSNPTLTVVTTNLWFGGRLIQRDGVTTYEDRLQSVGKYFPYGEDRYNPTPANPSNDQEKFATYMRDSISGLDYAVNRYYGAGMGRFMSPDPYRGSANPQNPPSWNKYMYAGNDPVNLIDPSGLDPFSFPCTVGAGEDTEVTDCEIYTFYAFSYLPLDPDSSGSSTSPTQEILIQLRNNLKYAAAAILAQNLRQSYRAQVPTYIEMTSDCWSPAVPSAGSLSYTLEVTYQILDSNEHPITGTGLTGLSITESFLYVTGGIDPQTTPATWTAFGPDGFGKTGEFEDYLSAGGLPPLSTPSGTAIQRFTVSGFLGNGLPLVSQPLIVLGFGQPTPALYNRYGSQDVTINGIGLGTNPGSECRN